jgi:asparagine synthase (glutamine-hydrolysing)
MCGFFGCFDASGRYLNSSSHLSRLAHHVERLRHRGPDQFGCWHDAEGQFYVGFRRLSIIDLSDRGRQPMQSASTRFVLAMNGEIYNHRELRSEIESGTDYPLKGLSDTEVLLAAIDTWGLECALRKIVGMYAFALWDNVEKALTLCRDRVGEKPLYFSLNRGCLLFGSELKAFRQHPAFDSTIDPEALSQYLCRGYVPAPRAIYQSTWKLPPASMITFRTADIKAGSVPRFHRYWSLSGESAGKSTRPMSDREWIDQLHAALSRSVRDQMVADVPVGAFLSSGIDSSLIVALMRENATSRVSTFTIGFEDSVLNEAPRAKLIAGHLETDHHEQYVSSRDALDIIPRLAIVYDEPFADSSQIPTLLLSMLARRHVTVSLSGDGGDELFRGYCRYERSMARWRFRQWIPGWLAFPLGKMSSQVARHLMPVASRTAVRLEVAARILNAATFMELYDLSLLRWPDPGRLLADETIFDFRSTWQAATRDDESAFWRRMMSHDLANYLPDDILVKVDRATMAVGLESRAPFLDHRVVELADRLPSSVLVRRRQTKWILRQILARYIPTSLFGGPKQGFGAPIGTWLRGPLRDWAWSLLDPARLRQEGIFQPKHLLTAWQQLQKGNLYFTAHLWAILMFQAWWQQQSDDRRYGMHRRGFSADSCEMPIHL